MAVFVIGDLHLSLGSDKPMDIFSGWQDYTLRLKNNWKKVIGEKDIVVLAGDISWAMNLENTVEDFKFIDNLPGKKTILKGNHDYWWSTLSKMNKFIKDNNFGSLDLLHNNAFETDNFIICGTRGWILENSNSNDDNNKICLREAGRLKLSLNAAEKINPNKEKVVFLHYPPISLDNINTEIINIMQEYNISRCYYGHLHGKNSIINAVQGNKNGIKYKLISADALEFMPFMVD